MNPSVSETHSLTIRAASLSGGARRPSLRLMAFAWLIGLSVAVSAAGQSAKADDSEPAGNETLGDTQVLEVAYRFDGGAYNKDWSGSGSPVAIVHEGQTILPEGTGGTFCCGYTFAVAMIVAEERGLLEGKKVEDVKTLQRMWFGAFDESSARNRAIREKQCALGVRFLKIGEEVKPRDAQPGDFLQFWRTTSGHSVVFLGWVMEDGQPVGVRYRSSQGSTNGIADKEERFAGQGGYVDPKRMYFARLFPAPE